VSLSPFDFLTACLLWEGVGWQDLIYFVIYIKNRAVISIKKTALAALTKFNKYCCEMK